VSFHLQAILCHSAQVYGTFVPGKFSRLRTFAPVNFRAREHNPNPNPNLNPNRNPNPGTEELSCLGAKVPLARKFRLPSTHISSISSSVSQDGIYSEDITGCHKSSCSCFYQEDNLLPVSFQVINKSELTMKTLLAVITKMEPGTSKAVTEQQQQHLV